MSHGAVMHVLVQYTAVHWGLRYGGPESDASSVRYTVYPCSICQILIQNSIEIDILQNLHINIDIFKNLFINILKMNRT